MASFGDWAGIKQALPLQKGSARPALDQGFPDGKRARWLQELHQGALHLPAAQALGDVHLLLDERVDARVVHARRDVGRRGEQTVPESIWPVS
jgi:hypothetical protein